ncbi:TasA anchoring/assembly protein [Bacillus pakistanensis]|uniref:TasA anchoring/assembly protein n=1 Tax=Rossellomorea pakistanensis TaxID=992288 RepID=A0ABS2NBQ3_9BACI|nr:amyloid fiber anchoring/assembly protein TapA [Bacillus pakistanensis]MBM7585290.1 TasA anchoring/assembly protein [Bacillus pakistanensis]
MFSKKNKTISKKNVLILIFLEGGINIRTKRLRKFKNHHWLYLITMKVAIILYALSFTLMNILGSTNAYFSDSDSGTGRIQAGTWEVDPPPEEEWDRSSLSFTGPILNNKGTISSTIINNGSDMAGTVTYEVWWIERGNPKKGEKLADGIVPALKSGQSTNLNYKTTKPGNYMFKAYQRPNHGDPNNKKGNGNEEGALWSESITVTAQAPAQKIEEEKDQKAPEMKSSPSETKEETPKPPVQKTEPTLAPKEEAPKEETNPPVEEPPPASPPKEEPNPKVEPKKQQAVQESNQEEPEKDTNETN